MKCDLKTKFYPKPNINYVAVKRLGGLMQSINERPTSHPRYEDVNCTPSAFVMNAWPMEFVLTAQMKRVM